MEKNFQGGYNTVAYGEIAEFYRSTYRMYKFSIEIKLQIMKPCEIIFSFSEKGFYTVKFDAEYNGANQFCIKKFAKCPFWPKIGS